MQTNPHNTRRHQTWEDNSKFAFVQDIDKKTKKSKCEFPETIAHVLMKFDS